MRLPYFNIILFTTTAFAQQLVVKTEQGSTMIPSETMVNVAYIDNAIVSEKSQNEEMLWIVELTEPSRIEQKLAGRAFYKSASASIKQNIKRSVEGVTIEKEFEHLINGMTITATRENVEKIAALNGVKRVTPDFAIVSFPFVSNASSTTSVKQSSTMANGKGVRIGVIDTGIDYNHEAFGSGFGDNFTVAGGFDFVNNDADPMDDNGHGTHVAGIISGHSSTVSGLANGAKLFAYKALDNNGGGNASAVIAALEQAVIDSIDVLNLSLGSPNGSPNDPLSTAVNRAVEAGIVVVVAAGNTGDFGTINSPGVAKFALTVGASDASNRIASFSSKGPVTEEYQIKPDVAAPGVGILSAQRSGGYVAMSGTSMATPFVTAIAAAMRELHPGWSAMQIRDAIISNATDIRTSLFSQGHGAVDQRILEQKHFISPSHLSFGFASQSAATWNAKKTVTISNNSPEKKQYRFSSVQTNPAVQFKFTPENKEIPAGGTATANVELIVNNMFLANNNDLANGYTGTILAISSADTLTIPYAFFKGTVMQLEFNEIPWQVLIHNQKNFSKVIVPKTNQFSLVLKEGTYDVVTSFYGSRFVVRESISVKGKSKVDISSLDAEFPLTFNTTDENGAALNLQSMKGTYSYIEGLVHRATGFSIVSLGGGKMHPHVNRQKYFSSLSGNYSYGYSLSLQPSTLSSYTYDVSFESGINAPIAVSFGASDIKRVDVKYNVSVETQRLFPITWSSYMTSLNTVSVTFYDGKATPLTAPFVQQAFYSKRVNSFPIFHQREAYKF